MSSSILYYLSVYSNISVLITVAMCFVLASALTLLIVGFISKLIDETDMLKNATFKKLVKYTVIAAIPLTLCRVFMPQPEILAAMYGVECLKELNTNAEVSATQLYKDITTIVHEYAIKKEK